MGGLSFLANKFILTLDKWQRFFVLHHFGGMNKNFNELSSKYKSKFINIIALQTLHRPKQHE